jgi:hypothetical protein
MANLDLPQGASPYGAVLSAKEYVAGAAVYPGDFVKMSGDGKIDPASAGDALLGVALGLAAADGQRVLVADHPDQRFLVQSDSADIDVQDDINLNYNIVATAANTTYKASRMELDGDTGATTATLPLKLLDINRSPKNALGANVECIVAINNHQLKGGTGTVGV